jgi:hypothetical protein
MDVQCRNEPEKQQLPVNPIAKTDMRSLLLFISLLAVSTAATATTHYVEVWNPPEARATQPRAHKPPQLAKLQRKSAKSLPKVRNVATGTTRVAKAPKAGGPALGQTGKRVDIPRVIGPDGQVLRVRDNTTDNRLPARALAV